MNIVYVEDNPDDARLVKMYVDSKEHSIVLATQKQDVEVALLQNPDLILMDIVLWYSREGHNIARSLRQRGYTQPIVAVTGLATRRDQDDCRRAGFTEVLTKPYTINQLAAVIDRYAK
jgi:CheY-like chemotaxis protein